jgi:hypothetical protein
MTLELDIVSSMVANSTSPLDQTRMPFLESLMIEKAHQPTSFHMPGHKGTKAPHPMLLEFFGDDLYPADLVEINSKIDLSMAQSYYPAPYPSTLNLIIILILDFHWQ